MTWLSPGLFCIFKWLRKTATHRGVKKGTFQETRGERSNSHHAGANYKRDCGQQIRERPASTAGAHWHSPRPAPGAALRPPGPIPGRGDSGPSGLPAHTHLLLLRWGCLGDFRGHAAPSAEGTPGRDTITGWPRAPGRRAATSPPAPGLPARTRAASENGRRLMTTRSPAALRDAARRAPAYLNQLLLLCDAQALPFFLQRSRLAPHLTSVRRMLSGTCSS